MNIHDYYQLKFGEQDQKFEFRAADGCAVDVLMWLPSKTDLDVVMYATQGAYAWLKGAETLCEFFIGLTRDSIGVAEEIAASMAEVAAEGIGNRMAPDPGDTVLLPDPLWQGTLMDTFLITNGDELIAPLEAGAAAKKPVRFLQLVPLFGRELAYKQEHGEAAMWDAFEKQEVPYWDAFRAVADLS